MSMVCRSTPLRALGGVLSATTSPSALYFELGRARRQRFVEDHDGLSNREEHGVVPLLHLEDDLVIGRVFIDRDQRSYFAFDLERAIENCDFCGNLHAGVTITEMKGVRLQASGEKQKGPRIQTFA